MFAEGRVGGVLRRNFPSLWITRATSSIYVEEPQKAQLQEITLATSEEVFLWLHN